MSLAEHVIDVCLVFGIWNRVEMDVDNVNAMRWAVMICTVTYIRDSVIVSQVLAAKSVTAV